MTNPAAAPVRRTHLPDLGPRGEGWVVLQLLLFGVVIGSGFAGPAWSDPVEGRLRLRASR